MFTSMLRQHFLLILGSCAVGLTASGQSGVAGGALDRGGSEVVRSGTSHPLTRGASVQQQAYLKAHLTAPQAAFGHAVSVSGNTVAVGAPVINLVYLFERSGTSWTQQAILRGSNTQPGDFFGSSVCLSGDTLVVGAVREDSNAIGVNGNQNNNSAADSGAGYVFVRSGTIWSQQAYLKASNTDAGDVFGVGVSLSDDTIVVAASGEDSRSSGVNGDQSDNSAPQAGAAYVFVRSGGNWSQQAYLKASITRARDSFGGDGLLSDYVGSVAVSGDTIVVGAFREDGHATGVNGDQRNNSAKNSGAAYVFVRNGAIWSQQAYLKASNTEAHDWFGWSVSVSGRTVLVGAILEDSNATEVNGNQSNNGVTNAGAVYVFVRSGMNWSQQAYLKASNNGINDRFGSSISVSHDSVVVGAPFGDVIGMAGAGASYVFHSAG